MAKTIINNNQKLWLSVVALVATTVFLFARFPHNSLWYDETTSAFVATDSWQTLWEWSADIDIHPPFYLACLKFWAAFTGSSEFSLRLFSLFSGILSLVGMTYLGRLSTGWWSGGWLASIILLMSGGFLYTTVEVRSYGFAIMLSIYSLIFYMRMLKHDAPAFEKTLYVAFTMAAMYTHYTAVFLWAAQFLYACHIHKCSKIYSLPFFLYLPWIFIRMRTGLPEGLAFEGSIPLADIPKTYWDFYLFGQVEPNDRAQTVALIAGLALLPYLIFSLRRLQPAHFIAALPIAGFTFLIVFTESKLSGRHTWLVWIGIAWLMAGLVQQRFAQYLVMPFLILLAYGGLVLPSRLPDQYPSDLRGAFAQIEAEADSHDALLLRDGSLYTAAEYYDSTIKYVRLPDLPLININHPLTFHEALDLVKAAQVEDAKNLWVMSWQGDIMDVQDLIFAIAEYAGGVPEETWSFGDIYLARYEVQQNVDGLFPHIVEFPGLLKIHPDNPSLLGVDVYVDNQGVGCPVIVHAWWWRGEQDDPNARVSYRLTNGEDTTYQQTDDYLSAMRFPQEKWEPFVPILGRAVLYLPEGIEQVRVDLYVYDTKGLKPEQHVALETIQIDETTQCDMKILHE